MSDESERQRQQIGELDQRVAQLKDYLANHPVSAATTAPSDPRPEPCWNAVSAFAPFVGIVFAFVALKLAGDGGWGFQKLGACMLTFLTVTLLGFTAAIIAAHRNEQRPELTVIGMVLNGIPTIGLVLLLLSLLRS